MNDKDSIDREENQDSQGAEASIQLYFKDAPSLPSNFSWNVMQNVYAHKIRHAQKRAIWESTLVSVATLFLGALLLVGYAAYSGSIGSWLAPTDFGFALPAIFTLAGYIVFDAALGIRKS